MTSAGRFSRRWGRAPRERTGKPVNSEIFAFAVAVAVFAGGCVGLVLQRVLHEKHTTGPSRDMIGAVVGLFTLLCALVTGLLIWTAYGVYAGQNTAIQTLASKVLQFDLALADYGPEANAERAKLRQNIGKAVDEIGDTSETDTNFATTSITGAIELIRNREKALESLHPSTDEQKKALAAATSAVESIGQGRLQMSFALFNPVSYPLLLIVVGWVVLLFCGFGLMSRGNVMSVVTLAVGAIGVASAILLILELSSPYSGLLRASPAPLQQALAIMGKE